MVEKNGRCSTEEHTVSKVKCKESDIQALNEKVTETPFNLGLLNLLSDSIDQVLVINELWLQNNLVCNKNNEVKTGLVIKKIDEEVWGELFPPEPTSTFDGHTARHIDAQHMSLNTEEVYINMSKEGNFVANLRVVSNWGVHFSIFFVGTVDGDGIRFEKVY